MKQVNEKVITVQDCIVVTVIDGGKVVGFVEKGVTNDK